MFHPRGGGRTVEVGQRGGDDRLPNIVDDLVRPVRQRALHRQVRVAVSSVSVDRPL